jgi:hypothetical protein
VCRWVCLHESCITRMFVRRCWSCTPVKGQPH